MHFDPFCFCLFWYRCLFPCYGPENWVKSNRLSTYIERLETTLICVENNFLFPFRKSIEPTWVITNLFTIQKKKSWCIDGDILHSLFMVWPFLSSSKYWFSVVNTQLFGIEQDFSSNSWKQMDANWAFRLCRHFSQSPQLVLGSSWLHFGSLSSGIEGAFYEPGSKTVIPKKVRIFIETQRLK